MAGTHPNGNDGEAPRALAIYLKDHHAAGSAGARLAARLAENISPDVEGRDELARVAQEVKEDLHTLERVMLAEKVRPNATKDTLAKGLELLGRLKPNGQVTGRAPLSDVIELETLLVGIAGKAALWRSSGREARGRSSTSTSSSAARKPSAPRSRSIGTAQPPERSPAVPDAPGARYSTIDSPEPPSSAGKSLSLGRPSFIGSTVDS